MKRWVGHISDPRSYTRPFNQPPVSFRCFTFVSCSSCKTFIACCTRTFIRASSLLKTCTSSSAVALVGKESLSLTFEMQLCRCHLCRMLHPIAPPIPPTLPALYILLDNAAVFSLALSLSRLPGTTHVSGGSSHYMLALTHLTF